MLSPAGVSCSSPKLVKFRYIGGQGRSLAKLEIKGEFEDESEEGEGSDEEEGEAELLFI
jgi:hypothetical protein